MYMKKTVVPTLAVAMMMFASPVSAQESDLPPAGITPASPFFFVERFLEGIGTLFTFGDSAKAERYLHLAQKRLAEARVLANEGDEQAQVAVELYEEHIAKARERAERLSQDVDANGGVDRLAIVTDATTKHLAVLDEVLAKVPEQARTSIQAAKERSMTGQIEALRGIAQRDPESAVEIYARAVEGRANAARSNFMKLGDIQGERVGGGSVEDRITDALEEFELYAAFGKEISALASGLRTGETTLQQLVERATSHHRDVLRDVRSKVPAQAQESIQRALDKSTPKLMERAAPVQPGRPAEQTQQGRSIPENSTERTTPESATQEAERENESEPGAGGPPAGVVPDNPGGRPQY
jgi:hypothetical protein